MMMKVNKRVLDGEESDEEDNDSSEEEDEDESDEEEEGEPYKGGGTIQEEEEDWQEHSNKRTFSIATIFNKREIEEKILVKCQDPCPCQITCRIKNVIIRECVCDPEACSSIMPYELYKFLKLGPLKETKEIFTTASASMVSVARIADIILVRIGE
ncbi:hypothetical protein PIB30_014036 [Stylosanthes scabra]|uniref:Uncharacterized protein n=1 Tax=Stylosanthes scabra TaxID=79078 RepID=A0ABU6Z422_9FABA|nr:hypothetical protein [Stylosanthes scabra]